MTTDIAETAAKRPGGQDTSLVRNQLADLSANLQGEIRLDAAHRRLYSTDASIYSEEPLGVAFPKSHADVQALVAFAARHHLPLIPRAGGTSLGGQVVGRGLVCDTGRHLTQVLKLDVAAREIRLQPGIIQEELNRLLAPHGLLFGPDTSTANRAMIGGMIGNNSCGSRSIVYGTTRNHVKSLRCVLADGSDVELGELSRAQVEALLTQESPLARLVRGLKEIVERHREAIRVGFPHPAIIRRNSGYALDYLATTVLVDAHGEALNLAKFVCGSEGTLAMVTEATLNVEVRPQAKALAVAQFHTLRAALEAAVRTVALQPSAVELIDRPVLDLTKDHLVHRNNRFFLVDEPEAVLMVEFYRDTPAEADAARQELAARLMSDQLAYACVNVAADQAERVWALRKAGLGLLMGMEGDKKPVAFVEDTAVRVEDLPAYIERFSAIMAKHGTSCVYYGHASVGELHLRPVLDLKHPADVDTMRQMAAEVADLVAEFRGALSGEHGDGRVRAPYLERVMGAELVKAFGEVKALWDPQGIFNPGKIVDPEPVHHALRGAALTGAAPSTALAHAGTPARPVLRFDRDHGLLGHLERCNGAGACRKLATTGGTMCPSYQVLREEMHSTRGRANLFRELWHNHGVEEALASDDMRQALDLCLACKGCKAECPASVDMAKVKAEFLQHHWDERGTPLRVLGIGYIAVLNRLGQWFPRLTNWVLTHRIIGAWVRKLLGFAPGIALPPVAPVSLRRWFAHHQRRLVPLDGPTDGKTVAIFVDEFTDAHEPEVGQAAIQVLEALGFRVLLPKHTDSGRPLLSKGLVRAAAKRARVNVTRLAPLAHRGIPILGLEPSAALTLVDEYPDLVPNELREDARAVARATLLFEDFLAAKAAERSLADHFDGEPRVIHFHGHCHQKALVGAQGAIKALSIPRGHQVTLVKSGCCGMAGSFGYEAEHRQLSLQVAELMLFPALRATAPSDVVAASGFSCRHQIALGLGKQALHPAQILRDALA